MHILCGLTRNKVNYKITQPAGAEADVVVVHRDVVDEPRFRTAFHSLQMGLGIASSTMCGNIRHTSHSKPQQASSLHKLLFRMAHPELAAIHVAPYSSQNYSGISSVQLTIECLRLVLSCCNSRSTRANISFHKQPLPGE